MALVVAPPYPAQHNTLPKTEELLGHSLPLGTAISDAYDMVALMSGCNPVAARLYSRLKQATARRPQDAATATEAVALIGDPLVGAPVEPSVVVWVGVPLAESGEAATSGDSEGESALVGALGVSEEAAVVAGVPAPAVVAFASTPACITESWTKPQ